MINKERSPNLRNDTRTHRVDLDWLSESEFGSFYFDMIRANQRSIGGYVDKGNVHHDAMEIMADDPMTQMMSAVCLANLSLAQLQEVMI